jgi:hypothetical protein
LRLQKNRQRDPASDVVGEVERLADVRLGERFVVGRLRE